MKIITFFFCISTTYSFSQDLSILEVEALCVTSAKDELERA